MWLASLMLEGPNLLCAFEWANCLLILWFEIHSEIHSLCSPDMNSVEHLWDMMKRSICIQDPAYKYKKAVVSETLWLNIIYYVNYIRVAQTYGHLVLVSYFFY